MAPPAAAAASSAPAAHSRGRGHGHARGGGGGTKLWRQWQPVLSAAAARLFAVAAVVAASVVLLGVTVGLSGWLFGTTSVSNRTLSSDHGGVENTTTRAQAMQAAARLLWEGDDRASRLRVGLVVPEVLSWSPRVVHLHHFLSEEECDELIALARPHLAKSTVVDATTGKSIASGARTSSGMFLSYQDRMRPTVQHVEERIATFSLVPPPNGELLQILRYEPGQYYHAHPDYFVDEVNLKRGGQRVATVLMYLQAAEEGGETHFPSAGNGSECSCGGEMKQGLCVRPTKGDAVLFWSTNLKGEVDSKSFHASCPVVKGEKWSCTQWLRQDKFV